MPFQMTIKNPYVFSWVREPFHLADQFILIKTDVKNDDLYIPGILKYFINGSTLIEYTWTLLIYYVLNIL